MAVVSTESDSVQRRSSKSQKFETWGDWLFQPTNLFVLLTCVNLLNYVDRGIIPGSTNEFNKFITHTVNTTQPDIFLGLLQSAFIVGFSLSSVVFGHAVHYYPPFFLCGCGLSIWVVAVLCSGLSHYLDSYVFLILSRALSGCGEASFQCSVPPWIQATADDGSKAKWISLFYTAIPVGTALGYVFSSTISGSIGWQWAFFLEAMMMAPFIVYLFSASPRYPSLTSTTDDKAKAEAEAAAAGKDNNLNQDLLTPEERKNMAVAAGGGGGEVTATGGASSGHDEEPPSMLDELKAIFSRPVYVCITLGYAAQTGALIGISTFGSAFLMGLGFFDTEMEASSMFGVLVSLSGIFGTLLGGFLLDKSIESYTQKVVRDKGDTERQSLTDEEDGDEIPLSAAMTQKETELIQVKAATTLVFGTSIIGAILMWCVYFIESKELYLTVIGCGCALLFLATPGINIGAMNAVPIKNRAFCMAMMSVMIHAFGDVPSPVIAGMIKDDLAPGCNGVDAASDACREDSQGIRETMLIVCSWFLWCIVFFGAARFISGLGPKWRNDAADYENSRSSSSGAVTSFANKVKGANGNGREQKNPVRGSSGDDLPAQAAREESFSF